MNTHPICIALLAGVALAAQGKADYLFTYQDSAGNIVGFSEPTLQASGATSTFLFDENGVTGFVFDGNKPSTCEGLASLATGCTGLATSTSLGHALFSAGSFTSTGTFSGTNGAVVNIVQYSGYLFAYQDQKGNILAFSEPTLQSSGTTNSFLFSTGGLIDFSFSGTAPSACGAIGSLTTGCTSLSGNTFSSLYSSFAPGSFSTTGTFDGSTATVDIVKATAAPEPATLALVSMALVIAGALRRRSARAQAC